MQQAAKSEQKMRQELESLRQAQDSQSKTNDYKYVQMNEDLQKSNQTLEEVRTENKKLKQDVADAAKKQS